MKSSAKKRKIMSSRCGGIACGNVSAKQIQNDIDDDDDEKNIILPNMTFEHRELLNNKFLFLYLLFVSLIIIKK